MTADAHVYIGIDPGITTGVAAVIETEAFRHAALSVDDVLSGKYDAWAQPFHDHFPLVTVVIEKTPLPTLSPLNMQMREVISFFERRYRDAVYILPGQWKPMTRHLVVPKGITSKHAQDAYKLATFYWSQQKQQERKSA